MLYIIFSSKRSRGSLLTNVFLIFIICSGKIFSQSLPYTNHQIPKDTAIKYIHNFINSSAAPLVMIKGGAFNRDVIDNILGQNGCIGIRVYYGMHDDGKYTFIIVGVDAAGDDLSDGIIAQVPIPCPPFCSAYYKSLLK